MRPYTKDSTVTLTDTTASYGSNMYFVNGQWQPTITVGLAEIARHVSEPSLC